MTFKHVKYRRNNFLFHRLSKHEVLDPYNLTGGIRSLKTKSPSGCRLMLWASWPQDLTSYPSFTHGGYNFQVQLRWVWYLLNVEISIF